MFSTFHIGKCYLTMGANSLFLLLQIYRPMLMWSKGTMWSATVNWSSLGVSWIAKDMALPCQKVACCCCMPASKHHHHHHEHDQSHHQTPHTLLPSLLEFWLFRSVALSSCSRFAGGRSWEEVKFFWGVWLKVDVKVKVTAGRLAKLFHQSNALQWSINIEAIQRFSENSKYVPPHNQTLFIWAPNCGTCETCRYSWLSGGTCSKITTGTSAQLSLAQLGGVFIVLVGGMVSFNLYF